MKKFLLWLLGFGIIAGITVLCYFFAYPNHEIRMPIGEYYLVELRHGTDKSDFTSESYEDSLLYLQVYEDNKVQSFAGESGFVQDGQIYFCNIRGTSLKVKNGENEVVYTGLFAEEMIIIGIESEIEQDGD